MVKTRLIPIILLSTSWLSAMSQVEIREIDKPYCDSLYFELRNQVCLSEMNEIWQYGGTFDLLRLDCPQYIHANIGALLIYCFERKDVDTVLYNLKYYEFGQIYRTQFEYYDEFLTCLEEEDIESAAIVIRNLNMESEEWREKHAQTSRAMRLDAIGMFKYLRLRGHEIHANISQDECDKYPDLEHPFLSYYLMIFCETQPLEQGLDEN